ncbi:DDE_3 domain-containing protein [Trichonephila clavipes]|nr:DDE_3 domain-containing protein [Trichonephila clavipes]
MTCHIYRDIILEQHVCLFGGAMGAEFWFMADNARPHRANIVDACLQSEDITCMDCPAYSPDLNPIEHVWDMLGRRIAAHQPPPTCLPELRRALLDEWCNIPQDQIDNLILSMTRRCKPVLHRPGDILRINHHTNHGRVRPSRCVKAPRESQKVPQIRGALAFIPRRFAPVFWIGFFTVIQSVFLIGLESAEGYPLPVNDIPQAREIPQNTPYHDVFMGTLPSSRRGNTSPFSVGRFAPVFWIEFFTVIQSVFLIGLESAEGYPLPVNDIPQAREIPQNTPYHDVFMGTLPSSRRGNTSPFSVG